MSVQSDQVSDPEGRSAFPGAPKKRSRTLLIVVVSVLLALCICIAAGVAYVLLDKESPYRLIFIDQPAAMDLADQFMRAMAEKDAEAAYALFSSHAQEFVTLSDLERFLDNDLYVLFNGYDRLTITEGGNFEVLWDVVGEDPQMPQGTVANLTAIAKYAGGSEATLTATLEKEGGDWRIYHVDVTPRPTP